MEAGTSNGFEYSLTRRRMNNQNICARLIDRETFGHRKPGTRFNITRLFHTNVCPNFTIKNVDIPHCFLRKFSPDGKLFIAFSADQRSLNIFRYNGAAAASDLFHMSFTDHIPNEFQRFVPIEYRREFFPRFFRLLHLVKVCTQNHEQLNRECSLFTDDGRYVIIGSAGYIPDDFRPTFYQIYSNNEAVCPNPRSPLENYSLHIVDLKTGQVTASQYFRADKIFLSHNQGVYLYKKILAVLSVQHQTIHIFMIENGKFIEIRKIGRFCYDDDPYLIGSVYPVERACREVTIGALKQRMLSFLQRQALNTFYATNDPTELRLFYQHFETIVSLKLWKMQLIDEQHLLLKYASEEVVTLKAPEPNSQPSFFVMYNMNDAKVLAVYENTSVQLLSLFENFCDLFRNTGVHSEPLVSCSPSNNLYARINQDRIIQTITNAKFGGRSEATRRILAQVPISAQSYSTSPYLDLSLFSYDDKWVSALERPKACAEFPIRMYARDSGLLKYRICAGIIDRSAPATARRLVAFTFHPTDPFAISIQRTNSEYIVNFHVWKSGEFHITEKYNSNWLFSPEMPFLIRDIDGSLVRI